MRERSRQTGKSTNNGLPTLYLEASEKQTKPDKLKVALLFNQTGDQAIDVYNTFSWGEERH